MKNKILSLALCAMGMGALTACSDYLETSSLSNADGDFVFSNMTTARAAMDGAYGEWHGAISSHIFGDGLYYAFDIAGSDIMRHPEKYTAQPLRHVPEAFYVNGTECASYDPVGYGKEAPNNAYSVLFAVLGKANAITSAIESKAEFDVMLEEGKPTELTQLYGEAVALRATVYRELIKYYGDVPFQKVMGQAANGLAPRDSIYDVIIEELQEVEPLMNPVGADKRYFSQTYVDALIGRMALEAGGYQTRRGDMKYVDGNGNALTFENIGSENNGATYGRRSDWRTLYQTAKEYFQKAIDHAGTAKLSPNYHDFFDQLHGNDAAYADESIYEEPFQQGASGNDPRPYSLGRPSAGGSSNNYPCKNYGQGRINPAFYYGMFDPKDLRRDISCTVTGLDGKAGKEKLIPFTPGSQANGGGIACNKFDESRQTTVWTKNQRRSGINAPYMRMAEVYLGLAEAAAALGDESTAKLNLKIIRDRAFGGNGNVDAFIAKEGSVLKAVIDERGFEFAGEGDRRFTLIRTGLIAEKIKEIKELTRKMLDGLKNNGYYTFDNGNTISTHIWTKMVDAKTFYGKRYFETPPAGMEDDPVLSPGWRGVNNDWETYGLSYSNTETNLAIKGLFTKLSSAEIADLEADGYKKTDWGKQLVDNDDEYYKYLFYQYDYQKAPIYLFPFSPNTLSTGGFTNGYGFAN